MKKIISAILLVVNIQGMGHTQDINGAADWRDDILRAREDLIDKTIIETIRIYFIGFPC